MKRIFAIPLLAAALLLCASAAFPAGLFAGYAGMQWGTDLHTVVKAYRQGTLGKFGEQVVYKQVNPTREISQRTFSFKNNRLNAVSVKFNGDYVEKIGMEHLLAIHMKAYGKGIPDRSSAPHMITYLWENTDIRITFAYSPQRPEINVLMYQQKK